MNQARVSYEDRIKQMMGTYQRPLLRYVTGMTHELETARDVVQEAFIRFVHADSRKPIVHPGAWLYRTCRNLALDYLRKHKRVSALEDSGIGQESIPCAGSPLTEAQKNDDARQLIALVDHLPSRERELLRLRYQGNLTYQQMSEVTGLSVSNVGYLLNQAINRLRTCVEAENSLCLQG